MVANHKMSPGSHLWFLFVVGYAAAAPSSPRWSEIHVPIGRSTFIQPDDVFVERRANGTSCKVKTITDDVANVLKVGRVEPPVFDCSFKPDSVRYVHSGNPLLSEDLVAFTVYQFSEDRVTEDRIYIRIVVDRIAYDVLINQPRQRCLTVSESSPQSDAISEDFLRFKYNFIDGATCLVTYVEPTPNEPFPLAGQLVFGPSGGIVGNITMDCRDFLRQNIRYDRSNTSGLFLDVDYVPLSVEVEDSTLTTSSAQSSSIIREKIYIEVRNVDANNPNSPPIVSVNESAMVRVEQFNFAALNDYMISAVDRETSSRYLVFNVTGIQLDSGGDDDSDGDNSWSDIGRLVDAHDITKPIQSFRQNQLTERRVAFYPTSLDQITADQRAVIRLVVIDSQFAVSETVSLPIIIAPSSVPATAPMVVYGRQLVVSEGGRQPITVEHLIIIGADNEAKLSAVQFHVRGGLRHGSLELDGVRTTTFTGRDLLRGNAVIYRHDGSDSLDDRIVLRVTNASGRHAVRLRLPVTVIPVDDSAPYLTANEPVEVMRGGFVQLTSRSLNASDRDALNVDRKRIVYIVTRGQPKAGEIVRRINPLTSGRPTSRFTQADVDRGFIYYRHRGGETPATDQFEFRLTDDSEGPNKSGKYSLEITVSPSDNIPPHELIQQDISTSSSELEESSISTPRRVSVNETDVVILGRDILSYEDVENRTDNVQYTITSQPYFVTSTITIDAGRLILLPADASQTSMASSSTSGRPAFVRRDVVARLVSRDGSLLTTFSQADVDDGRVAYVPPRDDIGSIERHVRFMFAVSDSRGACIMDQTFDITVMPVNNQLPHLSTTITGNASEQHSDRGGKIEVIEGGSTRLDAHSVVVYDPDTDLDKLTIAVEEVPSHGRLTKDGKQMIVGDTFTPVDLNNSDIRYVQEVAKTPRDKFSLSVFDGLHKVISGIQVIVRPPASVPPPTFLDNLIGRVEVDEGGEVVITTSNLAATGGPSGSEHQLTFHVLKSPEFGELRLDVSATVMPALLDDDESAASNGSTVLRAPAASVATVVYRFTQADVTRGAVRYVHTGGEIGRDPVVDVLTVTVTETDQPLRMQPSSPVPLKDVEVIVVPRDNAAPQLVVGGPIRVSAGQRTATITPDIITARDVDSPDDALTFVVTQTPMWGFIERSKPMSGSAAAARSGRSQTSRRVTSFSLNDLREGTVQYVPSNLAKGGGPPSDSFSIYVTDGRNRSPATQIEVSVTSSQSAVDPRLPEFRVVESLAVDEGGEKEFEVQLADRTLSRIVLSGGVTPAGVGGGQLVLAVAIAPAHGKLVLVERQGSDGRTRQTDMREMTLVQPSVRLIYRHDGSESREDGFTLSLTDTANNNAAFRKSVTVVVRAVNDESPILVRNSAASVDFGGTLTISNGFLKATDIDNFADEVYFVVAGKPKRGDLEVLRVGAGSTVSRQYRDVAVDAVASGSASGGSWEALETGSNFTQQAIDEKRLRYVHTTGLGELAPVDEFTFVVTDSATTLPAETFVIDISRANARRMLVVSREMTVRDGETRVVSVDMLSADDGAGRPGELTFAVTQMPQHGTLGLAGQSGTPLSSFTQSDLRSQRVLYKHGSGSGRHGQGGGASGGTTKDGFRFTVTSASRPYLDPVDGQFRIAIESSDRRLPTLDANVPLTVVEGDTATLTATNLRVSQPGTPPSNLTFIVVERPRRGELLVGGIPVARSFTQADIDSSAVEYHSEAVDETMTDYFLFAVADGRHDGYLVNGTAHRKPAFFNVLIQPASKDPPVLVRNRSPTGLQSFGAGRKGFAIGPEQLSARRAQPGGRASDLWFVLKDTCCRSGYLEHVKTGRPIRRKFSQKDVDDGNVVYIMNGGDEQQRHLAAASVTNDSFVFRVQDQHNNYLEDQRFFIEWSVITLEKSQYSVCESARRLDVVIRRLGSINSHVTANVRAKPLSARHRLDFVENSAGLVEFQPGNTRLTWSVDIIQDNIDNEPDERFKILLRNPTNAVIGDVSKAVVHILNAVKGHCPTDGNRMSNKRRGGDTEGQFDYDDDEDEEFDGFDENYEDRTDLFDSFGVDRDDDIDDNKDDGGDGNTEDAYRMRSSELRDSDLLPPPRDELTSGQLLSDDWEDNDDDIGWRRAADSSEFGRKGSRREHPLSKYRKSKKNGRKSPSSTAAGDSRQSKGSNERAGKRQQARVVTTTTAKPTVNSECTRDTSGLLYFDLLSSKMYRCSGREWQEWGYGTAGGDGFQYTALLKDAAAAASSSSTESSRGADDDNENEDPTPDNENDDETAASNQANTKKRKGQCKAGWMQHETSCYRMYNEKKSWIGADQTCKDDGGRLTEVRSKAHLMWLWQQVAGEKNFWIGLSDRSQSGVWQYENSRRPVEYFNWRRNFPRPSTRRTSSAAAKGRAATASGGRGGIADGCVQVGKRAEWVNKPCGPKPRARFICITETPAPEAERGLKRRSERQSRNG